jgi:DNA-binding MarR family transcriptional regulator
MNEQKANDIDSYALQVILTILHVIGNLRHSNVETTTEVELSYPQSLLLYSILEAEATTITQLSNGLKVTQGVVSRMVDRLEEKGLVERSRDQEDRRVVTVRLSSDGRAFALNMIDYHLDSLRKTLQKIPARDRETFLRVLKDIDREMETDWEDKHG